MQPHFFCGVFKYIVTYIYKWRCLGVFKFEVAGSGYEENG